MRKLHHLILAHALDDGAFWKELVKLYDTTLQKIPYKR